MANARQDREDASDEVKILAEKVSRTIASKDKSWRQKLRQVSRLIEETEVQALLNALTSQGLTLKQIKHYASLMHHNRYAEDLFASRAAADWLEDPDFQKAYSAGATISTWGTDIRWRVYTLLKCAARAAAIEGDFVECGVSRGGTATCVITHLGVEAFKERRFFLFDTFEGLVQSQMNEQERLTNRTPDGYFPPVADEVRRNFAPYDFVRIVPGAIPDTLPKFDGEKVAYLHIDLNVSLPELKAFEFFWPKVVPGGVAVFDDFGFPAHREQQRSLDDLAKSYGVEIMMLPTGQGLLWK